MKPERPMSARQASEWLGGAIDADNLIKLAQRGRIGCTKLPHDGAYLFFEADLLEYVALAGERREVAAKALRGAAVR